MSTIGRPGTVTGASAAADTGASTDVMRAAVLREAGGVLQIEEIPIPRPGYGEILIKVTACGVCHSDVHAIDGDWEPAAGLPLIPGHEVAGHVAAVGEGVESYAVGDAVGVPWLYSSCGRCEFCLAGMETICQLAEATGYSKPGGYAEYMIADAAYVARLPSGVDHAAIAPILCAGVTTYRGLKRSGARPGQWVVVVGVGGLGHIAVQYAVAMGLRVAAVDVAADKLALAMSLGAEVTIDATVGDAVAAVQQRIGGAHAVVVTAVATRAFEQAVGMLRPGGTAIYIGLPGGKADEIRMSIAALTNYERSVRGSNVGTRLDLAEAVDFAVRGQVEATIRTVRLEEINTVLDELRAGRVVGRVVITFE
jgi:propanol-preferring alcohol dehydrogenase